MSETARPPRLEMLDISQTFSGTTVLHNVSLSLAPGEVHALVGQNGAGKSTLMKILGGLHPDHQGMIRIDGGLVDATSPREATRHGVGMIYQELSLIPTLSVAENIMLGMEPGRVNYSGKSIVQLAEDIVSTVPMFTTLPLGAVVGDLSTGLQQRVEVAKALARRARVLVMDEPTARLSGPERQDLKQLISQLSTDGIAVIYISHFLEEVFEICRTVTILRNGRVVGRGDVKQFTVPTLTRAMLNEELALEELDAPRLDRDLPDERLVEFIDVSGSRVNRINLELRRGEVLGLAGLVGSGRTRLSKTLVGAEPIRSGEVLVRGRQVVPRGPRHALRQGIVMIPENRKTEGIIGTLSARYNIILMALDRGLARSGVIDRRAEGRATRTMFDDLEIRPANPGLDGQWFSGGNQQKILMARALLAAPEIIVADQPTAGVDVGTKAQIHNLIRAASEDGTAFVIASDDIDELLGLCDTVVVMKAGSIVSRHRRSELSRRALVKAISEGGVTTST